MDQAYRDRLCDILAKAFDMLGEEETAEREDIIAAGMLLEEAADTLPGGLPYAGTVFSLALEGLESACTAEDGSTADDVLDTVGVLLVSVQQWLAAGTDDAGADETAAAMCAKALDLWLALGKSAEYFPLAAALPADAAPVTEPLVSQLPALHDLPAVVMSLDPDDTGELQNICDLLKALEKQNTDNAPVMQQLAAARTALERMPHCCADEAEYLLSTAVTVLGEAAQAGEPEKPMTGDGEGAGLAPDESLINAGCDRAEEEENQAGSFAGDPALLAEFVTESLDHLDRAEAALLRLETDPAEQEAVNEIFRGFHTIKGTSGFLGLETIQSLAHHAEALLERARSGEITLSGHFADLALASADLLRTMVSSCTNPNEEQDTVLSAECTALVARLQAAEQVTSAEALVACEKSDAGAASAQMPAGSATEQNRAAPTTSRPAKTAEDATVRVRTDRLDALINMVGELVITNAMLSQDFAARSRHDETTGRTVSQLGKIIRELQDLGMSMRMVPLAAIFQKMARVVRDLSHKSHKKVVFRTEGEETEIDRKMVETLSDPLLHMIRNAVDHGIESPEQRRVAGKDETGTVTLSASHAAGSVVIELRDDGRGLDREKILAKAVARGVVESGRELTEAEINRLIFAPGLSTAREVTDVSGRGVGMDVVMRNIEALRGTVDVDSTPGEGTTVTIRIPLTLAIIDGMLMRVGKERYVLPNSSIRQAFCCDENQRPLTVEGRGEMVSFRETLLPVVRLHRIFNIPEATVDLTRALMVVVEDNGERFVLVVDELLGQQQIVIKSLGAGLPQVPGVCGGAILGDGRVGLILDPRGLAMLGRGEQMHQVSMAVA